MGETSKPQRTSRVGAGNASLRRTLGCLSQKPFSRSSPIAAWGIPRSDLLDLLFRCSELVLLAAHLPVVKPDQRLGLLCHGELAEALEGREEGSREFGICLTSSTHTSQRGEGRARASPGTCPAQQPAQKRTGRARESSAEGHVLSQTQPSVHHCVPHGLLESCRKPLVQCPFS